MMSEYEEKFVGIKGLAEIIKVFTLVVWNQEDVMDGYGPTDSSHHSTRELALEAQSKEQLGRVDERLAVRFKNGKIFLVDEYHGRGPIELNKKHINLRRIRKEALKKLTLLEQEVLGIK